MIFNIWTWSYKFNSNEIDCDWVVQKKIFILVAFYNTFWKTDQKHLFFLEFNDRSRLFKLERSCATIELPYHYLHITDFISDVMTFAAGHRIAPSQLISGSAVARPRTRRPLGPGRPRVFILDVQNIYNIKYNLLYTAITYVIELSSKLKVGVFTTCSAVALRRFLFSRHNLMTRTGDGWNFIFILFQKKKKNHPKPPWSYAFRIRYRLIFIAAAIPPREMISPPISNLDTRTAWISNVTLPYEYCGGPCAVSLSTVTAISRYSECVNNEQIKQTNEKGYLRRKCHMV